MHFNKLKLSFIALAACENSSLAETKIMQAYHVKVHFVQE